MTAPATQTPEPLLDLERLIAGIRWRRRAWVSLALLGLICGALVTVIAAPQPTALVRIMVVHEDDESYEPGSLMETDVALLQTSRIAAEALRQLDGDTSPKALLESYEATGLTDNVLELRVRGSSEAEAVARGEALAKTFIADHLRRVRASVDAQIQALRERMADNEAELAQATNEARRAELIGRNGELMQQIQQIAMAVPRVEAGTRIVDGPRPVTESLLATGMRNIMVGLALGLGAGLALAAVSTVVQDRPVLRREIASSLGASVIAQLRAPALARGFFRRRRRQAEDRTRLTATLSRIAGRHHEAIALLELGCADMAAALTLDIARQLDTGAGVVIVDDLPGRNLWTLVDEHDPQVGLRDGATQLLLADSSECDHDIGVGSVEPGTAWTDLPLLSRKVLLVVRAGHASAAWLHTVARQLADAGISVLGVVLVHPDPRDRSDGTLWASLHEAVRGHDAGGNALSEPHAGAYSTAHPQATEAIRARTVEVR